MVPTILIADVDRELCELYRQFFSHHAWQVQTSGGGLECLARLRQSSPHVLILDLQLPWGGADGLLAVMRGDPSLAHIPVILTSTEAPLEGLSGLVSPPVVQALWKPFSLTALLEIVRSGLGKREPLSRKERREPSPAVAMDVPGVRELRNNVDVVRS
ncbi:MAG: response regulator [Planctomycetes bacterium]|nr:response regulator [Planctomycetota bacterium]